MPGKKGALRINPERYARVIRSLMEEPCSVKDLRDLSDLCDDSVRALLAALKDESEGFPLIHVEAWEQDNRDRWVIPLYSFGTHPDAPKPPPRSRHERKKDQAKFRQSYRLNALFAGINPNDRNKTKKHFGRTQAPTPVSDPSTEETHDYTP